MTFLHLRFLFGGLALVLMAPMSLFVSETVALSWTPLGSILRTLLSFGLFSLLFLALWPFVGESFRLFSIPTLSISMLSALFSAFFFLFGAGFWFNLSHGMSQHAEMSVQTLSGKRNKQPQDCTAGGLVHNEYRSIPLNGSFCAQAFTAKQTNSPLILPLNSNSFGVFVNVWPAPR
jgi:hypothetical protein